MHAREKLILCLLLLAVLAGGAFRLYRKWSPQSDVPATPRTHTGDQANVPGHATP